MVLVFDCDHCGREVEVENDQANRYVRCPYCRGRCLVEWSENRPSISHRPRQGRKGEWGQVRTGLHLIFVGLIARLGLGVAWILLDVATLAIVMGLAFQGVEVDLQDLATPPPGIRRLIVVALVLQVIAAFPLLAGYVLSMFAPGGAGVQGWAIANLVLGVLALLCGLVPNLPDLPPDVKGDSTFRAVMGLPGLVQFIVFLLFLKQLALARKAWEVVAQIRSLFAFIIACVAGLFCLFCGSGLLVGIVAGLAHRRGDAGENTVVLAACVFALSALVRAVLVLIIQYRLLVMVRALRDAMDRGRARG